MTTIVVKVDRGGDDVQAASSLDTSSASYSLVSGKVFLRFRGVAVPAGATINTATLTLYHSGSKAGTFAVDTLTYGDKSYDQAVPASTAAANTIDTTRRTTASATGQLATTAGNGSSALTITSVIAEICGMTGWALGRSLTVYASGTAVGGSSDFTPAMYEFGNPSYYPTLTIDYTAGAAPTQVPVAIGPDTAALADSAGKVLSIGTYATAGPDAAALDDAVNADLIAVNLVSASAGPDAAAIADAITPVLTVYSGPAVASGNDNLADAFTLPPGTTQCTGNSTGYTVQGAEVRGQSGTASTGTAAFHTAWFRWRAPATGNATFSSVGTTIGDTYLTLWKAKPAVSTLTAPTTDLDVVWSDDDSGGSGQGQFTTAVVADVTYYLQFSGYSSGVQGAYTINYPEPGVGYDTSPRPPDELADSSALTDAISISTLMRVQGSNDDLADAFPLPAGTTTVYGSNAGYTVEAGETRDGGSTAHYSAWFTWKAAATATASFTTDGTTGFSDSYLSLWKAKAGVTTPVNPGTDLDFVASDDDGGSDQAHSLISTAVTAGVTYYIQVQGYSASYQGEYRLTYTAPAAPDVPSSGLTASAGPDSADVADSAARTVTATRSIGPDAAAFADTAARTVTAARTAGPDDAGTADAASAALGLARAAGADAADLTDSVDAEIVSGALDLQADAGTDPAALADAVAAAQGLSRGLADQAEGVDSAARVVTATRTAGPDTTETADVATAALGTPRTAADGAELVDAATTAAAATRTAGDPAELVDGATAAAARMRPLSEAGDLTDLVATARTLQAGPDGADLGDQVATVAGAVRAVDDTAATTDAVQVQVSSAGAQTLASTAEIGDSAQAAAAAVRAIPDFGGIDDTATAAAARARTATDTADTVDTVQAAAERSRTISDGAGLDDQVQVTSSGAAALQMADAGELVDEVATAAAAVRAAADAGELVDAVGVDIGRDVAAGDTGELVDAAAVLLALGQPVGDTGELVDAVGVVVTVMVEVADQVDAVDAVDGRAGLQCFIGDDIGTAELVGAVQWTGTRPPAAVTATTVGTGSVTITTVNRVRRA